MAENKIWRAIAIAQLGGKLILVTSRQDLGVFPNSTCQFFEFPIYPWNEGLLNQLFSSNSLITCMNKTMAGALSRDPVSGFWKVLSFLILNLNGRNVS